MFRPSRQRTWYPSNQKDPILLPTRPSNFPANSDGSTTGILPINAWQPPVGFLNGVEVSKDLIKLRHAIGFMDGHLCDLHSDKTCPAEIRSIDQKRIAQLDADFFIASAI